jgi:hypothetical protein
MFGNTNPGFKGVGDVGSCFFAELKRGAHRRNLEFNITLDYISKLFEKQKRKCGLSGLDLTFGPVRKGRLRTASLDRIDSSKGYIVGNVQWVHKTLNRMKVDIEQDVFIKICCAVADNIRKEK